MNLHACARNALMAPERALGCCARQCLINHIGRLRGLCTDRSGAKYVDVFSSSVSTKYNDLYMIRVCGGVGS